MGPVPNDCSVSCSRCGVVSCQSVKMIGSTFQMMDDANELLSKASRQLINAGKNLIDNSRSLPGEQTEDVLEASLHTIEAFRSLLQRISDALEYLMNWSDTINDDKQVQNGCCQNEMHPVQDQECPFTEQIKQLAENYIKSTISKVVMNVVANIGSNISFEDQKRHTPGGQPNASLQQLEVMNNAFGLTKQAAELILKASQTLKTGAPVADKTGLSMQQILSTNTEEVNANASFQSNKIIGRLEEVRDIIATDKECACMVLQTLPQRRSTADLLEMVNTVNELQIQTQEFTRLGKENGVQGEKDESGAHTVMQEPRNVAERVEQSQQISEEICNVVNALQIQSLEFLKQNVVQQIEDEARKASNTGDMVEVAKECTHDVAQERSVAGETTKIAEIVVWSGSIDVLDFAEDNEVHLGEDEPRKQSSDGICCITINHVPDILPLAICWTVHFAQQKMVACVSSCIGPENQICSKELISQDVLRCNKIFQPLKISDHGTQKSSNIGFPEEK